MSVFYDYFIFEHYFVVLVILKPNTSVIAEPNIFKIRKDSEASRSLIVPDFTISVYGSSGNSLFIGIILAL